MGSTQAVGRGGCRRRDVKKGFAVFSLPRGRGGSALSRLRASHALVFSTRLVKTSPRPSACTCTRAKGLQFSLALSWRRKVRIKGRGVASRGGAPLPPPHFVACFFFFDGTRADSSPPPPACLHRAHQTLAYVTSPIPPCKKKKKQAAAPCWSSSSKPTSPHGRPRPRPTQPRATRAWTRRPWCPSWASLWAPTKWMTRQTRRPCWACTAVNGEPKERGSWCRSRSSLPYPRPSSFSSLSLPP